MEQQARLHPLLGVAAISVIAVSIIGVGVLTGILPHPSAATTQALAQDNPQDTPSASAAALVSAASADPVKISPVVEPAPAPARIPAPKAKTPSPKKVAAAPAAIAAAPALDSPVAAAAPPPPPSPAPIAVAPRPACPDCGTVENFRAVQVKGDGSPVGAIAGGAAGALLGHQFGRGGGKDLLTIAGAVGGAFAGHEIEKRVRTKARYEISVRMEDGSLRTLVQDAAPAWHVGDRVRVVDNRIVSSA